MKASFVINPRSAQAYKQPNLHLPRAIRKALRVTTPKLTHQTATQFDADKVVTDWLAIHDPLNDRDYLCTNTVDPDFDIDSSAEFKDIDDELEGLHITEQFNEAQLWRFCTGYDIL